MRLSDTGRAYARSMVRRHRLAERLLVDVLGVPWHQVHEEACRLEHAISENLEQHLVTLLGDPGCCPHGNPIPGSANMPGDIELTKLPAAKVGSEVVLDRIDEVLEVRMDGLLILESNHLLPGAQMTLNSADASGVTITTDDREVSLPDWIAECLLVRSAG